MDQGHILAAIAGSIPGLILALGFFLRSRGRKAVIEAQAEKIDAKTEHVAVSALVASLTNSRSDLEAARRAWEAATRERSQCEEDLAGERRAREEEDERCRRNLAAMAREIDDLRDSIGQPRKMVRMLIGEGVHEVVDGDILDLPEKERSR